LSRYRGVWAARRNPWAKRRIQNSTSSARTLTVVVYFCA